MTPYNVQNDLFDLARNCKKFAGARICSAIIKNGKLRFVGFNQNKSHPFQKEISKNKDKIYLHAEVDVISQAKTRIDFDGCSIVVVRVKSDKFGNFYYGLSHPCEDCFNLIRECNFKNLFYTDDLGNLLKVKLN